MQFVEIRDLLNDFGLEAGCLIKGLQLFLPGALSSTKFWTTRKGSTLGGRCWIAIERV